MLSLLPATAYLMACVLLVLGLRRDAGEARVRWLALSTWLGLMATLTHGGILLKQAGTPWGLDLHFFAALSAVAWVVAMLSTLLMLRRSNLAALGLVVYPIAAACHVAYALRAGSTVPASPPSWQIQLHAALALLAYATLSLAAVMALGLWLQERALRRRQLAAALNAFPPLTLVESLLFRQIGAGFALLTLALLTGVVFVEDLLAQHLWHKTVFSLLAWIVFGALLFGRWRHGWRGRRAVRLTLVAMVLLALAFFGSKFVRELVLRQGVALVTG
ncbi:cytochrome C assembly family protein [Chiayiivirga sp.]|jgi:ABC-type uncharacterized transport system permease subunit|uniref:cytochrome C assembly family protein n=1 Tax=Chiayiivirga sp. TaxID=2041042 RepID=UPI0025B7F5F5|nr:cytochrome c biogenesis protein CcsA [Chiayiivirga sp.]